MKDQDPTPGDLWLWLEDYKVIKNLKLICITHYLHPFTVAQTHDPPSAVNSFISWTRDGS